MEHLNAVESELVQYFSEAVRVFGLPKSVGEIYGLLYASPNQLSMNDLIFKLKMSKGSCSQGLKLLREINAVTEQQQGRRTLYSPSIELKSLISGILSEQIQPLLQSTKTTVKSLNQSLSRVPDPSLKAFYESRITKLSTWRRRGGLVLPIISRILGKGP